MPTHQFSPVLGKRLQVTELDDCGRVIIGESQRLATSGFVTVTLSSEIEEGTEILQRNAAGALCVNERMADSFKRFTVEIEFCGVNPSLLSIVSNAVPYADYAGDIAGFTVAEGEITKRFALELWTGLTGQACIDGEGDEASGYMLLPFVQAGVLGDITIDGENAVTFSLTGAYTRSGNGWGAGYANVVRDESGVPSLLPSPLDPFDHLLIMDTSFAPPPSGADPIVVAVTPTGATAGEPGAFIPADATPPANLAALNALGPLGQTTAWAAGEYVVLGDNSQAGWNGTAWVVVV